MELNPPNILILSTAVALFAVGRAGWAEESPFNDAVAVCPPGPCNTRNT